MIRIGILGYGNLGKGVELAVRQNDDMELAAVYTRRNPETVSIATPGVAVRSAADLEAGNEDIDVLILCGGSATDLPEQTPKYAALYNVVDSFDTHAKIPTHFANVDEAAKGAGKTALISCGWDPGLFLEPFVRKLHPARRCRLHILGSRRFSGAFRCASSHSWRCRCSSIHHSRSRGAGSGSFGLKPRAHYARKAYA